MGKGSSKCHPSRQVHAKNLCKSCWGKQYYQKTKDKNKANRKEYQARWYRENAEYVRERARLYRLKNLERCRIISKKYVENNPDKVRLNQRRSELRKKYGITLGQYEQLFKLQGGLCAACGRPETRVFRGVTPELSVDHDHLTGQVRGLLCKNCNLALGLLSEDINKILQLAEYLKYYKSLTPQSKESACQAN